MDDSKSVGEHHIQVQRTARLATLGDRSAGVRDVWIVCHGFGQLARNFMRPFEAIAHADRLIVAPEALSRYYLDTAPQARGPESKVGATWMTREDREHEIADYVAYLDDVCAWIFDVVPRTQSRLTILGFSQGVTTVARWMAMRRVRADHVVLWAGAMPDDLPAGMLKKALGGRDVTVVAGDSDPFATPERVGFAVAALKAEGVEPRLVRFDGGHVIDRQTLLSLVD